LYEKQHDIASNIGKIIPIIITDVSWIYKISSNLFVAPMMKTFFFELMPSISVSSWLMTRSAAPPDEKH